MTCSYAAVFYEEPFADVLGKKRKRENGVSDLPAPSSSGCPKGWQWAPTPNFTEGTTELWQAPSFESWNTDCAHTHTRTHRLFPRCFQGTASEQEADPRVTTPSAGHSSPGRREITSPLADNAVTKRRHQTVSVRSLKWKMAENGGEKGFSAYHGAFEQKPQSRCLYDFYSGLTLSRKPTVRFLIENKSQLPWEIEKQINVCLEMRNVRMTSGMVGPVFCWLLCHDRTLDQVSFFQVRCRNHSSILCERHHVNSFQLHYLEIGSKFQLQISYMTHDPEPKPKT